MELRKQTVWQGRYRDINFKIINWGRDDVSSQLLDLPTGHWNYYVYIPESKAIDFKSIWLKDLLKRWSKQGKPYLTHDYMSGPVGEIDMHGGITYYAKHGHTKGYRCVEIGCDYAHSWDRNAHYDAEALIIDAQTTIDDLYNKGIVK